MERSDAQSLRFDFAETVHLMGKPTPDMESACQTTPVCMK